MEALPGNHWLTSSLISTLMQKILYRYLLTILQRNQFILRKRKLIFVEMTEFTYFSTTKRSDKALELWSAKPIPSPLPKNKRHIFSLIVVYSAKITTKNHQFSYIDPNVTVLAWLLRSAEERTRWRINKISTGWHQMCPCGMCQLSILRYGWVRVFVAMDMSASLKKSTF